MHGRAEPVRDAIRAVTATESRASRTGRRVVPTGPSVGPAAPTPVAPVVGAWLCIASSLRPRHSRSSTGWGRARGHATRSWPPAGRADSSTRAVVERRARPSASQGLYAVPDASDAARQQLAIPFDSRLARMRARRTVPRPRRQRSATTRRLTRSGCGTRTRRRRSCTSPSPGSPTGSDAGLHVHGTALPARVRDHRRRRPRDDGGSDRGRSGAGRRPAGGARRDGRSAAAPAWSACPGPRTSAACRVGLSLADVAEARSGRSVVRGGTDARLARRTHGRSAGSVMRIRASASPFESWSRGWMVAVGLPRPELNVRCSVGRDAATSATSCGGSTG